MHNITAIILTKDEEQNIKRCIESIRPIVDRIVVVDSGSVDNTIKIAISLGAEVFIHAFKHYADQFNWALDNVNINTVWVYRIDADECVTKELAFEIETKCKYYEKDDEITAFLMKYKIFFLGKFLKRGGAYPFIKISVFKPKFARFEDRALHEHVVISQGRFLQFDNDCLHFDSKSIYAFVDKHNSYSTREVIDYYDRRNTKNHSVKLYRKAEMAKRARDSLYYKFPMFFRAKLLYYYRYYIQLGFLDGKAGRIYAFLRSYWYRYLIDAKLYEREIQDEIKCLENQIKKNN